jgi:CubicO group peptidase (beta-lactamase class C family)
MLRGFFGLAILGLLAGGYPDEAWPTASPVSQGLSQAGVDAAAAHALKHGGGSGCIIRHGVLVKEWGDPEALADIKSSTKGSVGTTMLGLAVDAGLVSLDDLAHQHYPTIGAEKTEHASNKWLKEITIRHLATMTAGFDDGRPPSLTYRPGTRGIYSNDTSNMLAELLTIKFGDDLRTVIKARVMDPLGIRDTEWAWRANNFRAKTINGFASREFASGITITHRAMARIGYLYLRDGVWNGRRILSKAFVREATQPTKLPAPYDYYAFYWGTNGRGQYAEMPKDTFWALGLGDSFVLVCPSLDIVAVRLGVGSKKSHLPAPGDEENWGKRVEGFFRHVVDAVRDPLPRSPVIRGIAWAPADTIVRHAQGSDNWPLTWADDDNLYGAYGDGNGFEPKTPEKLSLGLARIAGAPPRHAGTNIRSPGAEAQGDDKRGRKGSGMLMVDGVLYMLARNTGNSQLAWSTDRGRTWTWSDWKFTRSFGAPTFLNFGRNYTGARDRFVYVFSHDADSAYDAADRMVLARVPKNRLRNRDAYEFFKALDAKGQPVWTKSLDERGAVFARAGKCYRSNVTYHAPSRRYLWTQTLPGTDARFKGGFAIHDAPEPWGPWTTVFYTDEWDVGPGETSSFPAKWMSEDGTTVYLVFSGEDAFSVRKATLTLR